MPSICLLPATCELCGHWIPNHDGNCPRNGVHPSQWSSSQISMAHLDHFDDSIPDIFKFRQILHEIDDGDLSFQQSTLHLQI